MTVEDIAAVVYAAYRATSGNLYGERPPGWEDASKQTQQAVRAWVKGALAGQTPKMQHDLWVRQMTMRGWAYGYFMNPAERRHVLLGPYDGLSAEQKYVDAIGYGIVRAFVAIAGKTGESDG